MRQATGVIGGRLVLLLVALCLALSVLPRPAGAQAKTLLTTRDDDTAATIAITDDLAPDEVAALLATMTDDQARRELFQLLQEQSEARRRAGAGGGLGVGLVKFRKQLEAASQRLRQDSMTLQSGLIQFPAAFSKALTRLPGPSGWGAVLGQLALFFLLGLAGFLALARLTGRRRAILRGRVPTTLTERLAVAGWRAGLNALPLAAFAVLAFGGVTLAYPADSPARNVVVTYLSGALLVMVSVFVLRLVLAPRAPGLRLLPLTDATAAFFVRWLTILAAGGILLWLSAGLIILAGMPLAVHLFVVIVTGSLVLGLVVAMVIAGRGILADVAVGSARHDSARLALAKAVPWALVFYVVVIWLHWSEAMLAREPTGIWSAITGLAILAALPLLDRWASMIITRAFGLEGARARVARLQAAAARPLAGAQDQDALPAVQNEAAQTQALSDAAKALEARERYLRLAMRVGRGLVGVVVLVYILAQFGLDVTGFGAMETQTWLLSSGLTLLTVILVSVLIWKLFVSIINPYMPAKREVVADEEGGPPQTRIETLMPLLRNAARVVLIVMASTTALSELGVNIGPLIAGAGVIGIAIGFGAQKLVQDIVSGVFFLIDDAFRIGEYVEFGELRGEVEEITVRSLKLRHHRGAIHTVPYSELRTVTNYNRDWVIYKMEFRLPHAVDIAKVKKIVKRIGLELMEDPEHGPNMLQPLKSQGISRMDETAVILRTKFMCKPREQFILRRVAYEKIKEAFAANGIEFAGRHVTVRSEGGGNGTAAAQAAAAGVGRAAGSREGALAADSR